MRLKHVPGAEETVADSPFVIGDETTHKGQWRAVFPEADPQAELYAELGCGKGQFLLQLAQAHPERLYLGVEMYSSVLLRAVEKQEEKNLPNLRFLRMDATYLTDVFAPGELSGIYCNFSDPWPKDRHAKRRLTSRQFLARYEQVLAPGAEVVFKTDNQGLFDFSLEEAEAAGWAVTHVTRDLHADAEAARGNVMTEYEQKFAAEGVPICRLIMHPETKEGYVEKE